MRIVQPTTPPGELRMALELDHAERYFSQEIANLAQPIIRKLLLPHAWSLSGEAAQLTWLQGVWLNRRRGMVLTSNGHCALWVSIEPPAELSRDSGVAPIWLHWCDKLGL